MMTKRVRGPRDPSRMHQYNLACAGCHQQFSQSWPTETEHSYPSMVERCHQTLRANGWRQGLFSWYCPDCRKARAGRLSQYLLFCGIALAIAAVGLLIVGGL